MFFAFTRMPGDSLPWMIQVSVVVSLVTCVASVERCSFPLCVDFSPAGHLSFHIISVPPHTHTHTHTAHITHAHTCAHAHTCINIHTHRTNNLHL